MRLKKVLLFLSLSFAGLSASANVFFFDINAFYNSDSLTTGTSSTSTKTFYDLALGYGVDKKDYFQIGWNISGHSTSDNANSVLTTYSSTEMGPIFLLYFGKNRNWRLSAVYNIQTTASYTTGASPQEKWKGTAIGASFGYQFDISPNTYLGVRMNYSSASYTDDLIGASYSSISYKKTLIYPSLALSFEL